MTKCTIAAGKELLESKKAHSVLTKINKILKFTGGCVNMWPLC